MESEAWLGLATVVAVLLGPICAVLITRKIDDLRLRDQRRMDLFRTLMRTRRMVLTPEHVGALNLVEIEFHGDAKVMAAWKDYYRHLNQPGPRAAEATLEELRRFNDDRDALLAKLLHAIAKVVRVPIEQLDIFQGGYTPQAWEDDENQLRQLRQLMIELMAGRRPLPVAPHVKQGTSSPFPPPPAHSSGPPSGNDEDAE